LFWKAWKIPSGLFYLPYYLMGDTRIYLLCTHPVKLTFGSLMNKILAVSAVFLLMSFHASSQTGNEWIDYSRPYYKIPTAKNGLYRLTYTDLSNAGLPVGSFDPQSFRIFHRGKEQAIYVEGEGDHQFDAIDFIEFYGQRNDGTQDTELYKPASAQPHKFYNLYSDTTAYFLTYGGTNGKRMSLFAEINGGLSPDTYHTDDKLTLTIEQFTAGIAFNSAVQYTFFDQGEGWTGRRILQNDTRSYSITGVTHGETSAGKPQLEVFLVGRNENDHQAQILVGPSQRLWKTVNFSGNEIVRVIEPIEWSDISGSGTLTVSVKALNVADRLSVSYIRLRYPQTFDATGEIEKVFNLLENPGGKSYIEIQNPAAGLRLFDITDPDNLIRIGTTLTSTLNAVIDNTETERKLLATNAIIIPEIHRVAFRNINPTDHDFIMITHPILRAPAGGYADPVKAYADYRASAAGGGYDTLLLNIQDVYDQFNYGELSPLAIHHLMKYLTSVKVPRYFFIVGKGLEIDYDYNRDINFFDTYRDLIPSAGTPASDNYYTVGLAGTTFEPAVPTGRISASSPLQVAAYLDKVKETEAQPFDNLRRKNLLHLSGGIEEGEPERFKSYVNDFKAVAEGYYLGGKVESIAKRSTDVKLISIAEEVNNGLGLVTFFGHSSATTLDFDIGYVSDPVMGYNNQGKYPMMLMHGCNVGSFFQEDLLFGEDWIMAANKGALGFIAHSFFGFEQTLKRYGDTFYAVAYQDPVFISKGIGDILKETSRRYMIGMPASPSNVTQVQQMILLGDPAVALFGATKPDMEINNGSVSFQSFDNAPITALTDSFKVNIVIRNFGQAKPGLFSIEVERVLNDNTSIIEDTIIDAVLYTDTISFTIRKDGQAGFGNNMFNVTVDADHLIDEMNEGNNTASRELFIPLNGTKNLFPRNFAIVDHDAVTLSWQTTDVFSDQRDFILELDTINTFDSPYKKVFNVNAKVLARQTMTLLSTDTLTYYWRTKLKEPLEGESDAWEMSSFTMIKDSPDGWAQVHFPQYTSNFTSGLVADATLREIKFQETITALDITTFGAAHVAGPEDVSVKIKGSEYNLFTQGFGCRDNSINLIAFDRRSTAPYIGVPFKWHDRFGRACGREPWVINNFKPGEMVTGNNDDIITYVDNIAAGDSVLLYSIGDAAYSSWPAAAKTKLAELGISIAQLNALQPGDPVIIFARKGSPAGTAKVITAPTSPSTSELSTNATITGGYTSGSMTSTLIGPAMEWQSFDQHYADQEVQDDIRYDIVGVKLNGSADILFSGISADQNLSGISATLYPYLKIIVHTTDDINLTSPQLDHWIVLYTPVPEGLITFFGPREQQFIAPGNAWTGKYGFVNIGDKSFSDSLVVRYETFNHLRGELDTRTMKIKQPAPGDTTKFDVEIQTGSKPGLNDVDVFVNPRIAPEQYFDNNVMSLVNYLNVEVDAFDPVLDVTVDGRRLADGDFVSVNPLIVISVWDENNNLLKTDLDGMKILLTYPCGDDDCDPIEIDLGGNEIKWYPATATTPFKIEFRPVALPEGHYVLHVEAADASGNPSGTVPYEISFNVKEDITVAIQPPYPNPFFNEVYLRVVMTGDVLPEQLQLEITDVNGKSIREFLPREVHIGANEWVWDGTDESGNTVPKGVYFYKAFFVLNGKDYLKINKIILLK
jgi:hypothetical protein